QCTTQSPAIHESRAGRHFRYAGPPALQSRRQTDPTCPPAGYGMPDLESIAPESRKHHVEDQGISKCDSPGPGPLKRGVGRCAVISESAVGFGGTAKRLPRAQQRAPCEMLEGVEKHRQNLARPCRS